VEAAASEHSENEDSQGPHIGLSVASPTYTHPVAVMAAAAVLAVAGSYDKSVQQGVRDSIGFTGWISGKPKTIDR